MALRGPAGHTAESARPRATGPAPRGLPPRALLVTIYGLYARDRGGALSVSCLVRLLAALDVDEPAARSLISRLKQRGILQPVAVSGAAGYGLTADGRRLLEDGDRRIYGRPRPTLADGWLLAVFSVPESERAQRHSLRARLAALGFGTVSAGVWIGPAHLADETADVLRLHHLDRYVELFTAAAVDTRPAEAVARWWDLSALAQLYRSFTREYRPVLERWGSQDAGDETAFADYIRVVTAWRRLPYRDPGLPAEVLPTDWPGTAAADLFRALRAALSTPAERHVTSMIGQTEGERR
jgi:phenylacetic acid degradation operon negative regulatory protein